MQAISQRNLIWSDNKNTTWEIFLSKSHAKNEFGDQFQTAFCFLKKLYVMSTQVVSTLALKYFGGATLGHAIKTNFVNISDYWSRDMSNFFVYIKGPGTSFSIQFAGDVSWTGCLYFLGYWVISAFQSGTS